MKPLHLLPAIVFGLAAAAASAQNAGSRTFTGVITDAECADANHSRMRMGDTDTECVKACVDAHGASYLLFDGKAAWELTDQAKAAPFAAKRVTVTGKLDTAKKRIEVESIAATS
jgi:uncharacterized protein DUF5818